MRVLSITAVALDRPMLGARHVLGLSRALVRLGADLSVLAPGALDIPGARRVRPPAVVTPGLPTEAALAALAARESVLHRPGVAYVGLSRSSSAVPAALTAARVPYVAELNSPVLDELGDLELPEKIDNAARRVLTEVVRRAKAVVTWSPGLARYAASELGAQKVEALDSGVDLDSSKPSDRERARRDLGLPIEQRLITLIGSLGPELRLDVLAEALRRTPGVGLFVAGDGPGADFVRAMQMTTRPSSPVFLRAPESHEDVVQAIRAADVCVDVRTQSLGLKSLEYAAIGRRQVIFETEGSERLLQLYPGLDAVEIAKEASPLALRDALERALDAEKEKGPLPSDAIERARAKVGWEPAAARLLEVLSCASSS